MERHQEGLLVAAEYKRMDDTSRGQEDMEANYCSGQGPIRAVASLKKKKERKEEALA
jgi:hypothetical protein